MLMKLKMMDQVAFNFIIHNGLRIYEVRLNGISNCKQMLVGVSCIYAVISS